MDELKKLTVAQRRVVEGLEDLLVMARNSEVEGVIYIATASRRGSASVAVFGKMNSGDVFLAGHSLLRLSAEQVAMPFEEALREEVAIVTEREAAEEGAKSAAEEGESGT